MIGPKEIRARAERRYRDLLVSIVKGENLFPLEIPFAKVKAGEATSRWAELRTELAALKSASSEARPGASYVVTWEERQDRLAGTQLFPARITFVDEASFLAYLRKTQECERFRKDLCILLSAFPILADWAITKPDELVRHAGEWDNIVAALRWFIENPQSGIYLREVPAVSDTKFIETRKSLFDALLCAMSQASECLLEACSGEPRKSFEERRGLRTAVPLIRLRVLDPAIAARRFLGLDDIAIPVDRFSLIDFEEIERVLIIENKTSFGRADVFLTAPALRGTIAIFGSGYATSALAAASWIKARQIGYWGDIDSHGLRILGAFRTAFPLAEALLMNESTFDKFPEYHSDAPADDAAEPNGLTADEIGLFRRLVSLPSGNRLEQERIPILFVRSTLEEWWTKIR